MRGDCYIIDFKVEPKATLWIGGGCEIFNDNTANIGLAIQARFNDIYDNDFWKNSVHVPIKSATEQKELNKLFNEFKKELGPNLKKFLKKRKTTANK